jgi:hypothetical protein
MNEETRSYETLTADLCALVLFKHTQEVVDLVHRMKDAHKAALAPESEAIQEACRLLRMALDVCTIMNTNGQAVHDMRVFLGVYDRTPVPTPEP